MEFTFTSTLDVTQHGRGTYYLFNVPTHIGDILNDMPILRGGFQSIKCKAIIGESSWDTSVFPSDNQYLLLIAKKWVIAENLVVDDSVEITLRIN